MKRAVRWLGHLAFVGLLFVAMGASAYFTFRLFVRGESVVTPAVTGRSLAEARAMASDLGVEYVVDESRARYSDQIPADHVVWQSRPAGSSIKRGSRLMVGRSLGPIVATVPDVTGATARAALMELNDRNLTLRHVSAIDRREPGVLATVPPAGRPVRRETEVSILVSTGELRQRFVMPDLIDRNADRVRRTLELAGFEVAPFRYESYPGIEDGTVIRQAPTPGYPVSLDDIITLTISKDDPDSIEDQGSIDFGRSQ